MPKKDLYLHYKSLVSEAVIPAEFDHIIEAAFQSYIKNDLTDKEYGRIYFACVARQNKM